jgi:hypothetical protein
MNLPEGSWVLYSNAIFTSTGTGSVKVHCTLGLGGAQGNEHSPIGSGAGTTELASATGVSRQETMSLTGIVRFSSPIGASVSMECYDDGEVGFAASYREADIGAIAVDRVAGGVPFP